MLIATASLWLGWWWTIVSIDPFATNLLGFFLFYVILFLALIGTFTLISVYLRKSRMADELVFHVVLLSFRQSLALAAFFLLLLFLQSQRLLTWWNVIILLALVIGSELFIILKERKKHPANRVPNFEIRELEDTLEPRFTKTMINDEN